MGFRKESEVLVVAAISALLSALLVYVCLTLTHGEYALWALITGTCAVILCLACVICIDIWRLKPADSHTLSSLVTQYAYILKLRLTANRIAKRLQEEFSDVEKIQNNQLMFIIEKNKNTAYGKDHGFQRLKSREDFRQQCRLTTYPDYELYVHRVEDGEPNVLTSDELEFLANSSATTGKIKRYPQTRPYSTTISHYIFDVYNAAILPMLSLKRMHLFHLFAPVRYTEGGNVPHGSGGNYIFKVYPYDVVPKVYEEIFTENTSYYVQALFCLADRELLQIRGFSGTLMYSFFKFIEDHIDELCEDIASGTVGRKIKLETEMRATLSKEFRRDPDRAKELRQEMSKGIVGLARRVWPDLNLVMMAKSGGFALCAKILDQTYLKGVKVAGFGHGASEGILGLVLEKEPWLGETVTMLPGVCFWEFIPIEDVESDNPTALMMHQLTLGCLYEIVVTTENGLYRCRFGDVIKIVGFNHTSPKYQFQYRLGQRLNIGFERTPEKTLYDALDKCSKKWPSELTVADYTTTESYVVEEATGVRGGLGHYVYFLEIVGGEEGRIFTAKHEQQIDEALCELREAYQIHRSEEKGSIGPLRIVQVKSGTFEELKRHLWGKVVNGQFKMPRVLRKITAVEFLLKQEVK